MSGTLKVGGKTLATHDTNTNVAKIQLGSTSDVVLTDSAGNNVLSEASGVVTLTADTAVIEGSSSGDLVRITQTGTGNALVVEDETNPDSTPFVVDSSGNVGMGTSTPSGKLNISDGTSCILNINSSASGATRQILFSTSTNTQEALISSNNSTGELKFESGRSGTSAYFQTFYTNNTERMRIDSSGNVKINNLGSGDVYATSGTLYISSDVRLKNDLGVINESGIEIIKQLTPRYYSWKENENNRKQLGFFAQEVFPILPEAVPRDLKYEQNGVDENGEPILEQVLDENGEPDYQWGFATQPIVAMLVKAIQEQQTLIESQQTQIDALTARIETLETT
jgi:hypothetical protein